MRFVFACLLSLLGFLPAWAGEAAFAADAVVAADGSGDYRSLQEAISAAPMRAPAAGALWRILVRPGVYEERIYVQRERGRMHIRGEDAARTVIRYHLHAGVVGEDGKPIGTFRTPTVHIDADDMIWENLTLANTAGPVGQALALRADGDRLQFRGCRFLGWQDTVLLNRGRHYFEQCYIEGHVDFIFGAATAWWQDCHIHVLRDGYITAASTPAEQPHGFVFADCRITGEEGARTYLGRPWRDYAATVFLRTTMTGAVRPEGWHNWKKLHAEHTARYAEHGSRGAGANDAARVPWARRLTESEAAVLTPAAVLGGADGWDPLASAGQAAPWMPDLGDGRYRNPVLAADYSDPDAVRVGDDYWLTSSSFSQVPGLPILHSRDLVNWRLVTHALPRLVPEAAFAQPQPGKGVWAPSLRHHDGKFWLYYPDPDFGIYLITATDPRGPWSAPVLVKAGQGLIDPCPLWDEDGTLYLIHAWAKSRSGINNVLTLLRLDATGTRVEEDFGVVIDGHRLPGYRTLEGPKLYRRNGWYYVFAPAGGVKEGWQSVFRARDLRGPYEDRIVLEQGSTPINGPHQGALVDTPGGEWWFLHFQDKEAYGRVVHLQPVRWQDDWPVIGRDDDGDGRGKPVLVHRKPALPPQVPAAPTTSDEFESSTLGLAWQWSANPEERWYSLTQMPGALWLAAQAIRGPNLHTAPNLLLQKFPAEEFSVTTRLSVAAGTRAGLVVYGASYAWLGVEFGASGARVVLRQCADKAPTAAEREEFAADLPGGPVELRVTVRSGARCEFSYRGAGEAEFRVLPWPFAARPGRWIGAKVGLFCQQTGDAPGGVTADYFRVTAVRPE
ncbi:MAG: family 43 glycosylhydrolase [Candidatus Didemnitutus sp.]|nr:family 43 glycosylhydrolase [Candidatus Didemnitutus sp.]